MPNIQVKLRRGTTAQHAGFTGAEGEVTVDTDKDTVIVHDGSTAGGHELRRKDDTIATAEIDAGAVDTAQLADDAVTPAKLDETQAYTVNGLLSDGNNIVINNTASTGAGVRFDKTNNTTALRQIDLFVDGNGALQFTAPLASTPNLMSLKNSGVLNLANCPTFADNSAAVTGGLATNDIYKTSTGELRIVV